jgi:Leucine-rich repeat (LRR) protein
MPMEIRFANVTRELFVHGYCLSTLNDALSHYQPRSLILSDDTIEAIDFDLWLAPDLEDLILKTPRLRMVSGAETLKRLTFLDAEGCLLSNFSEISMLNRLTYLCLHGCPLASVDGINTLRNISVLVLDGVPAKDFSQLASLTKCQLLSLRNTSPISTTFLRSLKSLCTLHADSVNVDPSDLEYLTRLQTLSLAGYRGANCEFFRKVRQVMFLDLQGAVLEDYRGLRHLSEVGHLCLRSSTIQDVSPLQHCQSLGNLDLRDTKVRDLNPLEHCPELYRVRVTGDGQLYREGGVVEAAIRRTMKVGKARLT